MGFEQNPSSYLKEMIADLAFKGFMAGEEILLDTPYDVKILSPTTIGVVVLSEGQTRYFEVRVSERTRR